ncbi:MAG: oligosaccharide flippase family protein [Bacteroidales bacterium]|nr:oligosaccharide flippase family protein [Candidatus Colimorpha pelethequi]
MSRFLKDSSTLIGGNVIAQGITVLSYFLLSRLYTTAEFGAFNRFYSYVEILIIFSTLRYELATPIAATPREAAAVARLSLILNTVFSVLLFPLILLLPKTWLPPFALLLPLMVFFCGTTRVYTALFNRFREFRQNATSVVVTSTTGVVAKILLAFKSLTHTVGLPLGTVLGQAAGNVNYLLRLRRLCLPRRTTKEEFREVSHKFSNFAKFTTPKDLINSLSHNLPIIWLPLAFAVPDSAIGLFGMALTFTFRPVNILNNAFEQVLYVRAAEKVRRKESIWHDIRKFILVLNACALPLFVVAFFIAEPAATFFFGAHWEGCGYYIRCLLPWVYVMLTSTSLMFFANVFGRQHTEFRFYLVLFLLRIAALVVGIVQHDFQLAILLFSVVSAIVSIALFVWYMRIIKEYEIEIKEQ